VKCGYHNNADIVGSLNIENRVTHVVLVDKLLKDNTLNNGTFIPNDLTLYKVKNVLLSVLSNNYSEKNNMDIHDV
jgi:hypothetical protein